MSKKTIAIDLDGTLAEYSGWMGEDIIGDPKPGAAAACKTFHNQGLEIIIFSVRARTLAGYRSIKKWLEEHEFCYDMISHVKYPAMLYIDDRGLRFTGSWNNTALEALVLIREEIELKEKKDKEIK